MGKSLMTCFFDSQRQMKSEENVVKSADRRAPCNRLHGALAKPQATRHVDRFIRFGTAQTSLHLQQ